ncbi:hypothetical protein M426DRAFT_321825 [Hypoxylon sp. CI-4A]|nr:hypothetical protein M426DRAFT_321825 [Hypoxylon sp. CI-4A]
MGSTHQVDDSISQLLSIAGTTMYIAGFRHPPGDRPRLLCNRPGPSTHCYIQQDS